MFEIASRSTDNDLLFLPLSPTPGRLIYDTDLLGVQRFSVRDHYCDSDKDGPPPLTDEEIGAFLTFDMAKIDDWSYAYLGYFIENDAQAHAFFAAYAKTVAAGGNFEGDLDVGEGNGNCGGSVLYRMRHLNALPDEAACLAEKFSRIPAVIEWPGNHRYMGGKVVYMGGFEEFLRYPGPFPMTESFIEGLHGIDALGEGHVEVLP